VKLTNVELWIAWSELLNPPLDRSRSSTGWIGLPVALEQLALQTSPCLLARLDEQEGRAWCLEKCPLLSPRLQLSGTLLQLTLLLVPYPCVGQLLEPFPWAVIIAMGIGLQLLVCSGVGTLEVIPQPAYLLSLVQLLNRRVRAALEPHPGRKQQPHESGMGFGGRLAVRAEDEQIIGNANQR